MTGFWGKLPSRGDFVGAGLPRDTVAAWDSWVSAGLAASQTALGDAWRGAWMEAPVWCFAAAPGLFGAAALGGLWMPSADSAGRLFPLLLAAVGGTSAAWLNAAERAGRAALEEILAPEALSARLPPCPGASPPALGTWWWTEGSPRVSACRHAFPALPAPDRFAAMLADTA